MFTAVHPDGFRSHSTEAGTLSAAWAWRSRFVRVQFVDDSSSNEPAFRWPDEPMPEVRKGHIAFQPDERPDLQTAREWLPQYSVLWDAIEAELRDARSYLFSQPNETRRQHTEFLSTPPY